MESGTHATVRGHSATVHVRVYVYDHIRDKLGRGQVEVELPVGTTVAGLFRQLASEAHPLFGRLTEDDSSLYGVNLLVLNGERIRFPADISRELQADAVLHLIPPITGG